MDPQKLSAQELVQLCLASQDPALWCEFVSRFRALIFGVVVKTLRRSPLRPEPALIDDLIQETFLKVCTNNYRALRDFDYQHEHSLFGFLKKVASNVVQDHIRKVLSDKHGGGMEEEDLEKASFTVPARSSVDEDAHHSILMDEVANCLAQLSGDPNYQRDLTIFWLYYRYGFTAQEISRTCSIGLSVKGVESALLRLTRHVRSKLAGPEPSPPSPPRHRGQAGC
jgi:RNA polymerase sigma-70 factor (ECF subfamily)